MVTFDKIVAEDETLKNGTCSTSRELNVLLVSYVASSSSSSTEPDFDRFDSTATSTPLPDGTVKILYPSAFDGYRLFEDLCVLTTSTPPTGKQQLLMLNHLPRPFGLELIESILSNYAGVFRKVCPHSLSVLLLNSLIELVSSPFSALRAPPSPPSTPLSCPPSKPLPHFSSSNFILPSHPSSHPSRLPPPPTLLQRARRRIGTLPRPPHQDRRWRTRLARGTRIHSRGGEEASRSSREGVAGLVQSASNGVLERVVFGRSTPSQGLELRLVGTATFFIFVPSHHCYFDSTPSTPAAHHQHLLYPPLDAQPDRNREASSPRSLVADGRIGNLSRRARIGFATRRSRRSFWDESLREFRDGCRHGGEWGEHGRCELDDG